MSLVPARVGLQQRVLPEYRIPFFDSLATSCLQGLSVFAGNPREDEAIETSSKLTVANYAPARNLHLFSGRFYLNWQMGLLRWLRSWNPHVLIVEANPRYLSTPLAVQWMHLRNRPVIGWGLGTGSTNPVESLFRRRFLRSLDAVIAYSRAGALQYISAGIDPQKVFVAANAAVKRPSNPPYARPLQFKSGRPEILFVGRLQDRKRLDVLLQACAALPTGIQPRLVVIGDGPERARLESLAWGTYPNAEFIGARYGQDLEPYYASADLFVLPGTGGLAVQQAMAHGLPVIVGVADGTQGELVREENGWVLPDPSPENLAKVLKMALEDIPRLRKMGQASYRIVAEEVNLETMVDTFARAIRSVMK